MKINVNLFLWIIVSVYLRVNGEEIEKVEDYSDIDEEWNLDTYNKLSLKEDGNEDDVLHLDIIVKIEYRAALNNPKALWENGLIPYKISNQFSTWEKSLIENSMNEFKKHTCIKFTRQNNDENFLVINPGKGCSATVGKVLVGSDQTKLGKGCFKKGIIMHELMHVLGFVHEHNRPDRDQFVKIITDNIENDKLPQFEKYDWNKIQDLNLTYDYNSIMHYGEFVFAKNRNKPTIIPLRSGSKIGQRLGFSDVDILKINKLYDCKNNSIDSVSNFTKSNETLSSGSIKVSSRGWFSGILNFFRPLWTFFKHVVIGVSEYNDYYKPKKEVIQQQNIINIYNIPPKSSKNEETVGSSDITKTETSLDVSKKTILQPDIILKDEKELEDSTFTKPPAKEITFGDFALDETPLDINKHLFNRHIIQIMESFTAKTALRETKYLWTEGIVPYVFSDKYDKKQKKALLEAMEEFRTKTCTRFVEKTNQKFYIFITPGDRCAASIGFHKDIKTGVILSDDCYLKGTIIHELMHVLGFIHEQNRPDRDNYVKIMFDNIEPNFKHNFKKYNWSFVQDFGLGYDYESIMHYEANEFAINDKLPTIVALKPGVKLGQREGFSKKDLIKINKLYNCTTKKNDNDDNDDNNNNDDDD